MIKGDSTEYALLEKWTKDFDCQGFMTAEVGVREGLGSKIMLDNLKNIYFANRNEEIKTIASLLAPP